MQTACYVLIGLLLAGYATLGWLHLGIGALEPFLGREDAQPRSLCSRAKGTWDGKEVWLASAGTLSYAAFPSAGLLVLRAFLPLLVLALVALVAQAATCGVLARGGSTRVFWGRSRVLASVLPVFLFGVMAGNLIRGLPLAATGAGGRNAYAGTLLTLLNPYALLMGLVAVVAVVRHAAAWIALTATGALELRARRVHFAGEWVFLGAVVAGAVGTAFAAPQQFQTTLERGTGLTAVAALAIALAAERLSRVQGKDMGAFVGSAVSLAALLGLWATGSYPFLVRALDADGPGLTLAASAAPMRTLIIVTICGAACLVALTSWAVFRLPSGSDGRTSPP